MTAGIQDIIPAVILFEDDTVYNLSIQCIAIGIFLYRSLGTNSYSLVMASAMASSQGLCTASMAPASQERAMAGSMGRRATLGMPYCWAMASRWLSPKMACFSPHLGHSK